MDPTYPWEELGWQEKALEGKEKQEWSKRTKITIFGKKAFWRDFEDSNCYPFWVILIIWPKMHLGEGILRAKLGRKRRA